MKLLSTLLFLVGSLVTVTGQYQITNFTDADGLVNNVVNCVTVDANDHIWFGTNRGISKFDGSEWTSITLADNVGLLDEIITAIYARENGEIWIGTDFGAGVWDGATFTNFTDPNQLGNLRVQAITEGNEGDMFFGTKGGWARLLSDGSWTDVGLDEGLPFGGVKDLEIDDQGSVWAGLGLEGMVLYNYLTDIMTFFSEPILLNNSATGVALDQDKIWVTSGGGVDQLNLPETSGFVDFVAHPSVFTLPPPHELNQAVDVQVDSKETVWVGIFIDYLVDVGGVSYYEDDVWHSITTAEGLVGPGVNKLAIDSNDCVWVATSTGVSKICAGPSSVSEASAVGLRVYPNPITDNLYVQLEQPTADDMTIGLYDMQGQRLCQDYLHKGQSTLTMNTSELISGTYLLRVGERYRLLVK